MVALLVILALLMAYWVYRIATTLRAVNARQRANLAGCTGYPISKSSRRPAVYPKPDPLRAGEGRAEEHSWLRFEMRFPGDRA